MRFEHATADLDGIAAERLTDGQALAGLLLAAATAAGLSPAAPPTVVPGPRGFAAMLLCHGGHVALHAVPEAGLCFVDVAGLDRVRPQRGLDVVIRRLAARALRSDARRRGPVTHPTDPETS